MGGVFDGLIEALAWTGTAAFATAGALTAARKRMDPVGFVLVAAVTAFGGGTVRDLILGVRVGWLDRPDLVMLASACALAVFFTAHLIERRVTMLLWVDAAGMAVFAVLGAEAASRHGATPWVAVLMGTITASFGGLIRDVICGEIPLILRREIYATAAAAGAAASVALNGLEAERVTSITAGLVLAFAIRAAALTGGWSLPAYRVRTRPEG
ncbi:trimeric intracellular cation channel family protein [Muricoccus radiodurans]|uniref:trimeric intracellular cation channel family protein n=1 Tax=Muricoccus radiodurans TaxID=2231721 RepID=UPI003CF799A6